MPDIMVYKHRKAQLALFRSVSRERIDWATYPTLPNKAHTADLSRLVGEKTADTPIRCICRNV